MGLKILSDKTLALKAYDSIFQQFTGDLEVKKTVILTCVR